MRYTLHEDPGHGWLEVPIRELAALGIEDKITGYSFIYGESAFLEEDCDLATFIRAAWGDFERANRVFNNPGLVRTQYWRDSAPCRGFRRFPRVSIAP